ncbi:MAG TPA: UrcA family protein [Brevundimonas sp.]|nr:UrcA family protein [Brevundimonas sp.]
MVAAKSDADLLKEFAVKTLASLAAALSLAAVAGSASAYDARIVWGDLDLSSAEGAAAFDARVDRAARRLCRGVVRPATRISDRAWCMAAVRREAVAGLPGAAQVDYALSRLPIVA